MVAPSCGRFREPCRALPLLSAMTRKVGSGSFPYNIHSAPPASGSNPRRLRRLIQETAFSEVGSWQDVSRAAACSGVYWSMGNSPNLAMLTCGKSDFSTASPLPPSSLFSSQMPKVSSSIVWADIHPSIQLAHVWVKLPSLCKEYGWRLLKKI